MKFSSLAIVFPLVLCATAAPPGFPFQGAPQNGIFGGKSGPTGGSQSGSKGGVIAGGATGLGSSGGVLLGNSTSTKNGTASSNDPQTSTTLDPKVIATGFANDGQDVPTEGQIASATSNNNFINFCLTVPDLEITNGKQITTGSCNPAPMGVLPGVDKMPSCKFVVPKNGDTFKENTAFTISMAVSNLHTGAFVNAAENYFAAPQQLDTSGTIIGHSHVVVEQLTSLNQATPTDPKKFAFFKGLNAVASGGILTADVTDGLPAGFYKLSSINSAANHQPVLVPIAQHGSLDDVVYFTITASGASNTTTGTGENSTAAGSVVGNGAATASSTSAATSATSSTKGGSANNQGSNKGNQNLGDQNKGNQNSGDQNKGNQNSGNQNSGGRNDNGRNNRRMLSRMQY